MSERIRQIMVDMRKNAADELEGYLRESLPFATQNPPEEEGFDVDEASLEEADIDGPHGMAFEFGGTSGTDNLEAAAAAWRTLGTDDDLVAHHIASGRAFMGRPAELAEYTAEVDVPLEEWNLVEGRPAITRLAFDQAVAHHLAADLEAAGRSGGLEDAKDDFEGFHWGNPSGTVVAKEIPGLDPEAPVTYLGLARKIYYGSKKGDDGWIEYYHDFGEDSGQHPSMYSVGPETLVIHGAGFSITPDGLKD